MFEIPRMISSGQTTSCRGIGVGLWLLMLWLMVLPATAQDLPGVPGVSSSLSSPRIAFEESVTFTVLARGVEGELDVTPLTQDFEIVGRSESQQVRIVNGVNDTLRQWVLQLTPRTTGLLTVPAVTVGGVSSNTLVLDVADAPTGADRVLFVTLDVDVPDPWVQQQVYITVRIFHRIPVERYQVSIPEVPGLSVLPIEGEVTTSEQRDGVSYDVIERRYAAFPQESGTVTLQPFVLTALVPADPSRVRTFMSPTRRVQRRTEAIDLEVRPRPDDVTTSWWLPSRSFELASEWNDDTTEARVGEPLSRRVSIVAEGVLPTQLPDTGTPEVDGASVYIDEPEDSTVAEISGLVTQRVVNWAIIPQREGELRLPAIEVEWFDSDAGLARVARLPEEVIDVQAAVVAHVATGTAITPSSPGDDGTSNGTGVPAEVADGSPAALIDDEAASAPAAAPAAAEVDALHDGGASAASVPSAVADPAAASAALGNGINSDGSVWRLVAMIALAGWLLTGLAFGWRERGKHGQRRSDEPASVPAGARASAALSDLDDAVGQQDLEAAASAIRSLAYARGIQTDTPAKQRVPGLTTLAARQEHAAIADELRALDARLYSRLSAQSNADPASSIDLRRIYRHFASLGAPVQDPGAVQPGGLPAL